MTEEDSRVGTTLKDKWRIDKLLGRGGTASVYAATHRNGRRVAVKILHRELSAKPELRARFVREGYVANKVNHPGAVLIEDDDVTPDGAAFLIMELLQGETLDARRERSPGARLPAHEVAGLIDQVLDTLAAAHAQGIAHRDLKPDNLFLSNGGVVKILDLGIARLREAGVAKSATESGTILGTPAYLPPEQARGRWDEVDARSDLWSVGATMFTLLAGRCVHEAETVNELLLTAMTRPAPAIRSVAPDVPVELASVVDRALARDREARYPSAQAMRVALRRAAKRDALAGRSAMAVFEPTQRSEGPSAGSWRSTVRSVMESTVSLGTTRARSARLGVVLVAGVAGAVGLWAWAVLPLVLQPARERPATVTPVTPAEEPSATPIAAGAAEERPATSGMADVASASSLASAPPVAGLPAIADLPDAAAVASAAPTSVRRRPARSPRRTPAPARSPAAKPADASSGRK